jgi:ESCRT-II complex subunit VPS25
MFLVSSIQVVEQTRAKQMEMWTQLVVSYAKHHRLSVFGVTDDVATELWGNAAIKRRLPVEGIRMVLNELVGKGMASWVQPSQSTCVVSWRRFDEWAEALTSWARSAGKVPGVCTLAELRSKNDHYVDTVGEGNRCGLLCLCVVCWCVFV